MTPTKAEWEAARLDEQITIAQRNTAKAIHNDAELLVLLRDFIAACRPHFQAPAVTPYKVLNNDDLFSNPKGD